MRKAPFTEASYEIIMRAIESTSLIPWFVKPWSDVPSEPGWHEIEIGAFNTQDGYGIIVRAQETKSSLQVQMLGNGSPQTWEWEGEAFEKIKKAVQGTDPNLIPNFVQI
jgi:hypothetical protein